MPLNKKNILLKSVRGISKIIQYILCLYLLVYIENCKKANSTKDKITILDTSTSTKKSRDTSTNITIKYPPVANSIGFFLDSWEPKTFIIPASTPTVKPDSTNAVQVSLDFNQTLTKIPRMIFGNNVTSWIGQIFNNDTLIPFINNLSPNVLRFPGGSISDVYFWNLASAPPGDVPNLLLNSDGTTQTKTDYWFGNRTQSWTISLDNYYKVLAQTSSTGIITVNYAYARYGLSKNPVATAAHLAANWVRYDKGRTHYWEIGNENFGYWEAGNFIDISKNKDGQPLTITGALYGSHFKVFADSMRVAAQEVGATIKIGALLYISDIGVGAEQDWNSGMLSAVGNIADFFIVHNYYNRIPQNSSPSIILNTAFYSTKGIMDYYQSLPSRYNFPVKPLALTEWNINVEGNMQKVSNIAGLHAISVLGELLNNHYGLATRWDIANSWKDGNDHGMFNNGEEPGAIRWNPRPAFYYMYYFQRMMGDRYISSTVGNDTNLHSYASGFSSSGQASIILVNTGSINKVVKINTSHFNMGSEYYFYTLNGGKDNGGFSRYVYVNGVTNSGVSGGPSNYSTLAAQSSNTSGGILVKVPSFGAVFLVVTSK